MTRPTGESVPQPMRPAFDAIVALTDPFCAEHLNAEYAELCRKMAAALGRKRPSPLLGGKTNTWAAAIVHAVGSNNFLFDRSQPLYLSAADLAAAFGLATSTVGNKSRVIRDALKMHNYDWHWALPSKVDTYPGAWYISVDGLMLDARHVSRDIQEEAARRGLIPYLPPPGDDKLYGLVDLIEAIDPAELPADFNSEQSSPQSRNFAVLCQCWIRLFQRPSPRSAQIDCKLDRPTEIGYPHNCSDASFAPSASAWNFAQVTVG
jgi:hypothetical protein